MTSGYSVMFSMVFQWIDSRNYVDRMVSVRRAVTRGWLDRNRFYYIPTA